MDLDGREPDVEVEVDEVDAPPHIVGLLGDGRVCCRRRRFSLDGRRLMLATSYIPVALAAEAGLDRADTGPGGMYARLAELGHAPKHAREQLRSRLPLPEEAEALDLEAVSPVTLIVRTVKDTHGLVVEVCEMVADASRYLLEYDFDL